MVCLDKTGGVAKAARTVSSCIEPPGESPVRADEPVDKPCAGNPYAWFDEGSGQPTFTKTTKGGNRYPPMEARVRPRARGVWPWLVPTVSMLVFWGGATGREASACVAPACVGAFGAPADGRSIPASAPALVYSATDGADGTPVAPIPGSDLILEAAGALIPFTVEQGPGRYFWILPATELAAGSYTLSLSYPCGPAGETTWQSTFSVTPAVPSPTTAGTVALVSRTVEGTDVPIEPGNCVEQKRQSIARFELTPSPEMVPFVSLAQMTVTVDGQPWQELPYGSLSVPGATDFQIAARCDQSKVMGSDELSLGDHTVGVSVDVPKLASFALPSMTVTLSCDTAGPSRSGAGCSTGGAPVSSGWWSLVAVGAWALVIEARRRGRERWAATRTRTRVKAPRIVRPGRAVR